MRATKFFIEMKIEITTMDMETQWKSHVEEDQVGNTRTDILHHVISYDYQVPLNNQMKMILQSIKPKGFWDW